LLYTFAAEHRYGTLPKFCAKFVKDLVTTESRKMAALHHVRNALKWESPHEKVQCVVHTEPEPAVTVQRNIMQIYVIDAPAGNHICK
jgi:hypothetical protein